MPEPYAAKNLPPLVSGVLSRETWTEARRTEILEMFSREEYGRIPDLASLSVSFRTADSSPGFMAGRAIRRIVEIIVHRQNREFIFPLYLFIPSGAGKPPAPVILTLNNRAISDADPARSVLSPFWPAEQMVARGYAAAVLVTHDIAPDYEENFTTKFHRLFPEYVEHRPPDAWGAVTAWAWGMSRAIDYLQTDPAILGQEIAVAGHSRGGKTALWCGAQDPRAALVISSSSGCSGAAITRGKAGERVKDIVRAFPFWFCGNYQAYADNEEAMPFDQHELLALIAPRPLYLSWKTFDTWCDPRSEFESLRQAGAVYTLYGKSGEGLGDALPAPEQGIVAGSLGCHLKSGAHNMDEYDWARYLDFCDRHLHPVPRA